MKTSFLTLPLAIFIALSVAPAASAAGTGALDRAFFKADINEDGFLNSTEFLALQSRRKSWTDTTYRFGIADVDNDDLLSLVEFRASKGGKIGGKPNKPTTFALADSDDSGTLDPYEFALTLSQSKPWRKVLRDFDRKDRDDNSEMTTGEFGIRTYSSLGSFRNFR